MKTIPFYLALSICSRRHLKCTNLMCWPDNAGDALGHNLPHSGTGDVPHDLHTAGHRHPTFGSHQNLSSEKGILLKNALYKTHVVIKKLQVCPLCLLYIYLQNYSMKRVCMFFHNVSVLYFWVTKNLCFLPKDLAALLSPIEKMLTNQPTKKNLQHTCQKKRKNHLKGCHCLLSTIQNTSMKYFFCKRSLCLAHTKAWLDLSPL